MDFFGEHSVQVVTALWQTALSHLTVALVTALAVSAALGLVLLLSTQSSHKPVRQVVPQRTGIQQAVRSLYPERDDVLTCLPTRAPPLWSQRPGPSQPPGVIFRR